MVASIDSAPDGLRHPATRRAYLESQWMAERGNPVELGQFAAELMQCYAITCGAILLTGGVKAEVAQELAQRIFDNCHNTAKRTVDEFRRELRKGA